MADIVLFMVCMMQVESDVVYYKLFRMSKRSNAHLSQNHKRTK